MDESARELQRRWRLILGPDAGQEPGERKDGPSTPLNPQDRERDRLLDYLYAREYENRQATERRGGREASRLDAPQWLRRVRVLFPGSTAQRLQQQALERYGLAELLSDPEVLAQAQPSLDLVRALLSCRSLLQPEVMAAARQLIRKTTDELRQRLSQRIRNAVLGRRLRGTRGGRPGLANLDWPATLRHNLKHYDLEGETLLLEHLFFTRRQRRQLRWDLFIVVDQSASMLDSVIHSAVTAAIFSGLQTLNTRLILFDTSVIDVTGLIADPVELLLGLQLGGGTDIAQALDYAAAQVQTPRRTLLVLITDFYEGGDETRLLRTAQRLKDSGVTLLGLAALDERAAPDYDHDLAGRLAACGMAIAAMTPDQLADWVGEVCSR